MKKLDEDEITLKPRKPQGPSQQFIKSVIKKNNPVKQSIPTEPKHKEVDNPPDNRNQNKEDSRRKRRM